MSIRGYRPHIPFNFPWWVVKKEGNPIHLDADFLVMGYKYGAYYVGAASVNARDTNHYFGGTGAVLMTTGDATNDLAEFKIRVPKSRLGRWAFEQKWWVDPTNALTEFRVGIENRTENKIQACMQYVVGTKEWRLTSTSAPAYTSLNPACAIWAPEIDAAANLGGDFLGWTRLIVDLDRNYYERFQCGGKLNVADYNLRAYPMVDFGDDASKNSLLFYTLVITKNNAVHTGITTDWCITKLDD